MKEMAAEDIQLLPIQQMVQTPVKGDSTKLMIYVASFTRVDRTAPETLHPDQPIQSC